MATDLQAAGQAVYLEGEYYHRLAQLINAYHPETMETPLHLAVKLGRKDIVEALLDSGADTYTVCTDENFKRLNAIFLDRTPTLPPGFGDALHLAVAYGHISIFDAILEVRENEVQNCIDHHPLVLLAAYGHVEALNNMLARGFQGNPEEPFFKHDALRCALANGYTECARSLIFNGADVTFGGSCLLGIALKDFESLSGNIPIKEDEVVLELVQMLVEAGADVNATTCIRPDHRMSPSLADDVSVVSTLIRAVHQMRWKAASYLLEQGADITVKDEESWTAFHYAVASGNPELVDSFLKAGAADQIEWSIKQGGRNGYRYSVSEWNILDIVGMLRLFGHRNVHTQHESLVSDFNEIIKLLVDNGASVEAESQFGGTPLHSACFISHRRYIPAELSPHRTFPIVSALLQSGANPNALNKFGQNPLHVLLENVMVARETFLDNYKNSKRNGENPSKDIEDFMSSLCSTVRVLVAAGADLNHRDVRGEKPLHTLFQGLHAYINQENDEYSAERSLKYEDVSYEPQYGAPNLADSARHKLDPLVVELLRCGADSWEVVPEPCLGLEKALFDVWKRGGKNEMRFLFGKLEDHLKPRLRTCLLVFNSLLPGQTELHMQILAEGLQRPSS
jgi:ankyrin repeat protein